MSLKYVSAYLMATIAREKTPEKPEVEKILESIGAEIDQELLCLLFSRMEGKSVDEVLVSGLSKLNSGLPRSGPPAGAANVAGDSSAAQAPEAKQATKQKEEVAKVEEEEDDDIGLSLFD